MTPEEETHALAVALKTLAKTAYQRFSVAPPREDTLSERGGAWTPARAQTSEILHDPLLGAYRVAIQSVGERLFEIGGVAAMGTAIDHALDGLDGDEESYVEGLIDHRWDGIGDGVTGWVA